MITFRTSEALIKQIKKIVKVHGRCFVTGCGNLYYNREDAERKMQYTNPSEEEATFMVSYTRVEDVPNTPRELEDAFFNSKRAELSDKATVSRVENHNFIDMSEDDEAETPVKAKKEKKANEANEATE